MLQSSLRKASTQRSVSVFDRLGHSSQIPHKREAQRKKKAPFVAAFSVQDTPDELKLMRRRLAELEAKQKNTSEEYTTDRHSPFTEDILAKPLPEKLKMPQLTSYEDGNDPVGHLDRYTSWMELQGARDAIMCIAFPITFGNRAMRWFKKLPQRSIRSWNDLSAPRTAKDPLPPPRYQGYHILNTSLENVLMKTKGKDILKKPAPMRASLSELNQRRRGHLKEFLARPPGGGEPPQPQDRTELPPPPQPGRCKIHMIVGGSQYLEGSRRQRRKLSREAHNSYQVLTCTIANLDAEKFSFSEEDASHVLQPHSDALVITMPVSGVNVHRTLVDDGSSVNILYLRTFKQMDIDAQHVRPFPKPLQGFTGDYVNSKGQIALVVELGLPPCHRRIIADFVIVDFPSNYNAILGRPILHELKAAASIVLHSPPGRSSTRKSAGSKELQHQLPPSRSRH
ncbi:Retrotrans gag domain-containing protein [Abeliophyllum distichum]|uniref:Retrotrans gag domain-containing protein n=1 Tax=Abeliophyllum distichum TaxID=126358 RepID=A0ABD1S8U8_9LAMI